MRIEDIPVGELIEECVHSRGAALEGCDISLETDLDDPQATLRGDRRLLRAAVANLIDIAARRVRPGGKITIAYDRDSRRESIAVSDDGIGIDYEELRSIRDLFSRSGMRAMDDEYEIEPSLVGLSVVRDVADLHRGRVGVRNLDGEGSIYTLHLPCRCA